MALDVATLLVVLGGAAGTSSSLLKERTAGADCPVFQAFDPESWILHLDYGNYFVGGFDRREA